MVSFIRFSFVPRGLGNKFKQSSKAGDFTLCISLQNALQNLSQLQSNLHTNCKRAYNSDTRTSYHDLLQNYIITPVSFDKKASAFLSQAI